MIKVDSKKTIRSVSSRFMQVNRGRNIIVIVAIIMTTVMFTSLFSALLSMMKSTQQQEIRMNMSANHITAENLTKEKFAEVSNFDKIESFGYSIHMSKIENEELINAATEMSYADKKGAEAVLSMPTTGRMPEKYNEVAMSTISLDFLGIPRKVGCKVRLEYTLSGKKQTEDFILSGYWKGDPLFPLQQVWTSKEFCMSNTAKATAQSIEKKNTEGTYTLYIWCENIFQLSEVVDEMEVAYHFSQNGGNIYYNSAYDIFVEDGIPIDTVIAMLLIIFAAGYLIIYNVFRISVNNDIRTYGLLKNIGMTGRQLKSIVRRQAMILSVIGIPLRLLIGYFIGVVMTPYLLSDNSAMGTVQVHNSTNPLIFIVAAILSTLTIYIGCQMPARIVSKISAVEAMKMNLEDGKNRKVGKKTGKIRSFTMAANNMKRTWKKAVLVILSLALPMILLNAAYSMTKSFDYEQFLDTFCSYDFDVSGITHNRNTSNMNAITPDFIKKVSAQDDTEKLALIYNEEMTYRLDDKGYENLKAIVDKAEEEEYIKGYYLEREQNYLKNRKAISHVMGINKDAYEKMQFLDDAPTYEKFAEGNYVIVSDQVQGLGAYYDPGDKIRLELEKGRGREYTVLQLGWMPYDLSYRFNVKETAFDCTFYLPVSEYMAIGGDEKAMLAGIDVREGSEKSYDQWLADYTQDLQPSLYVESRVSVLEQCKGFSQKYYVILGLLSGVLFIIGLLNFFNTSSVTIMARRRELALLEAVGQTKGQIRKMLIIEGLIYLAAAVILADTVGMAIASPMVLNTVGQAFYFSYHPSLAASFMSLPLMAMIAIAVPVYNYKKMGKETIVERLQND